MNIAVRTEAQPTNAAWSLPEDEAIVALLHLYLELQLPPPSAWRAAQADYPRLSSERLRCADLPGGEL